jgi:protein SCO1/2
VLAAALWLAAVATAGAFFWLGSETGPRSATGAAQIGGPFSLIDPTGRTVTDRDFRGKFMLIYFGYTHCPDVCPITLAKVAAALQMLDPRADHVQPIFITVDPRRDTPEVMGRYATEFSPRILGLTGSPAQIAAVEKAYKVYASPESTPEQLDAAIDHSSILYLMGPGGSFIAPVRIDGGPADLAADVGRYLKP